MYKIGQVVFVHALDGIRNRPPPFAIYKKDSGRKDYPYHVIGTGTPYWTDNVGDRHIRRSCLLEATLFGAR